MENIKDIVKIINESKLFVRISTNESENLMPWQEWITMPNELYIDVGLSPIRLNDIVYIEINCTKKEQLGRLMPIKKNNIISFIENQLNSKCINYTKIGDNILRLS